MQRIQTLIRNAGISGVIRLIIVGVCLFWCYKKDLELGILHFTLAISLACFILLYPFRRLLVEHANVSKFLLNGYLIAFVVIGVIFGKWMPNNEEWFRMLADALIFTYLGGYFWLLSDPDIVIYKD